MQASNDLQEDLTFAAGSEHEPSGPASAWRELPDGSVVAFTAIAIDRFVVDGGPVSANRGAGLEEPTREVRRAWTAVVETLAHLTPSREFWHLVTTRQHGEGEEGALRVGWTAVGRGPTVADAVQMSAHALDDLHVILAAHYDFFTARRVSDAKILADFLEPAVTGRATALRRMRWEPPLQVEGGAKSARRKPPSPGALLPWPGHTAPWAPLLEGLATQAKTQAFVVRCQTAVSVPQEAVARAQADLLGLNAAMMRLLGRKVSEATPVHAAANALADAAGDRLKLLEGPCLIADAVLVGECDASPGLRATLAATMTATTDAGNPDRDRQPRDMLPVAFVELPAGSMWVPLDPAANPELLVGPREAVTLIRTPEPPVDERSPLPCSRARVLPLRSAPTDGTVLGDGEMRGDARPVRLPDAVRFQHVYIVGQTGTGKSTLMLNMILGDIAAGHGLTVLDPHGSLNSAVLDRIPPERLDDVIVVDPSDLERPVGLNLLDVGTADPAQYVARRDALIDELFDTFEAIYDMRVAGGPMFEQYFRSFLSLVMGPVPPPDYVPLLPMLTEVLNDRPLAEALTARLADTDAITSANLRAMLNARGETDLRNITPYIVSKLNRFYAPAASRRMLCQSKGLDFADILRTRKIVLVDVPAVRLGGDTSALIARQVIAKLANEAMRRGTHADNPPHFVYADEFHQFATERFAELLAEARKFRLGLVLAHQYTSQLVRKHDRSVLDAVLGNVGTVVAFRVGAQDAQLLDAVMAPRATAEDIAGLPNHVAAVRSVGDLGNVPFTLRTRSAAQIADSLASEIRERSRLRYGVQIEEVDAELGRQLEALRAIGK